MSIGSRIREIRIKNGISREELAATIGVTKGAISNYENAVSHPKNDILIKIMETLKCDANYLYQDDIKHCYMEQATPKELELIKKYRTLDEKSKEIINYIAFGSSADGSIFK